MGLRDGVIDLGFRLFDVTHLHRVAAPFAKGLGAILMFHRVRENVSGAYAPNRGLEITPTYLDAVLTFLRERGFAIVTLDEALRRLDRPKEEPFVALTFDDGTRDTLHVALPILAKHDAPFTVFVTTGFADRSARMWWLEVEEAVSALDRVEIVVGDGHIDMPSRTPAEKTAAFSALYRLLRAANEPDLLTACASLCGQARLDPAAIVDEACLTWRGVRRLAQHPLVTVGAHTLTHPRLAKLAADIARREIAESRAIIEAQIDAPVLHLAYPVGDPSAAGPREFADARDLGFSSAVTTRPGMLFAGHADHRTALPRLSINGGHQTLGALDVLLSGVPFLMMNRGRRLSVA